MTSITKKLLSLGLVLGLPLFTMGATDGTLGTTSTGTSDITLTVADIIQISDVGDLAFGTYSGGVGDITQNDDVCIYNNDTGGTYQVTISGDGAASAFTLTDGSNTIAYTVEWNDVTGLVGQTAVSTTVALTAQSGANTASLTCAGGTNANFEVTIDDALLQLQEEGAYTGTLTILVDPE